MKRTLVVIMAALVLSGCSQGPDFSTPVNIVYKETSYGSTKYELANDQGDR